MVARVLRILGLGVRLVLKNFIRRLSSYLKPVSGIYCSITIALALMEFLSCHFGILGEFVSNVGGCTLDFVSTSPCEAS